MTDGDTFRVADKPDTPDGEAYCDFCPAKLQGGDHLLALWWIVDRRDTRMKYNHVLCSGCADEINELASQWTESDRAPARVSHREIHHQADTCGFCGGPLEEERCGCEFASSPEDEYYTFCRNCYDVVSTFLEQVREERSPA